MTLETILEMFPRLSHDEAREVAAVWGNPKVREALDRMKAACSCVAGSLYCTCVVKAQPSEVDLATVASLAVVAARGARILPAGG